MYKNKTILAIVPARGGSKGIPKKNLKKVNGIPLVCLAGLCAKKIQQIDRVIISTDSEEIRSVSRQYGLDSPFKRPKNISRDYTKDIDVLIHSLAKVEKIDNKKYDIVVLLQPTSPLRTPKQVYDSIKYLINKNYDSVWSVSETSDKFHPFKQLKINKQNSLEYFFYEGNKMLPRQQLNPTYHVNGIAYVLTRECIFNQKTRLGLKTGAFLIKEKYVNIDTIEDLQQVQKLFEKVHKNN